MKTSLTIFLLFCCIELNAQLFVHAGVSPLKGTVGAELQIRDFSLNAGYRFTRLWSVGNIHSFSASLNYYFNIDVALCYFSLGAATKGVVHKSDFGTWDTPIPAYYAMVGIRYYPNIVAPKFPDRISFDIGTGLSATKYKAEFLIEFEINWKLIKL